MCQSVSLNKVTVARERLSLCANYNVQKLQNKVSEGPQPYVSAITRNSPTVPARGSAKIMFQVEHLHTKSGNKLFKKCLELIF